MRESQIRKIQKNRHMAEIYMSINGNSIFKNLSYRDKQKLCKLVYKAEMVEMHVREKSILRANQSFQEIINNVMRQLDLEDEDLDDDDFGDTGDLPPGFGPKN